MSTTTITYVANWRSPTWPEWSGRPAWLVECSEHPHLGKDSDGRPWGYAEEARAKGVRTKHERAYHGG